MKPGTFYGQPHIIDLPGPRDYEIVQRPDAWWGYYTKNQRLLVPRNGEHTDQGSIPWIAQAFVSPDKYKGFYFHDDLYQFGKIQIYPMLESGLPLLGKPIAERIVSRAQADMWLLEMMLKENELGVGNRWESREIYEAVRHWGWRAWNRRKDGREKDGFHF